MILVDSSVWIDYFNGIDTSQTDFLDRELDRQPLAIGDLILVEVLQGFGQDRAFLQAMKLLAPFPLITLGGPDVAVDAAENFRRLRRLGQTVRGTIDTVIATRCINDAHELLHDDKDFQPFIRHLGLRSVLRSAR